MHRDILVIGAGIIGLSSAYHLKRENPDKEVLVVDKFGGAGQGNSAKSTGGFRNIFSSETNYLLSDSTIEWFKHLENILGYNIRYHPIGYLWLFSEEKFREKKEVLNKIKDRGTNLSTYDREDLKEIIPDLVTQFSHSEEADILDLEPVDIGVYGHKCGSLDPDALVKCYEQEFFKLGGEIRYNTQVTDILLGPKKELGISGEPFLWQEKTIQGGSTHDGDITADTTVVATGVWSEQLLSPIGVDPLMRAKKRQLFAFKDPNLKGLLQVKGLNEYGILPLTVLPRSGIFVKGEVTEGSIWLGAADSLGRKFDFEETPQAEERYYQNDIYQILVNYFPCFSDLRPINMWAGQYAINSFDEIPIVTSIPGMIYVGAASGSGIMKSDALGRVVSALYRGEKEAQLFNGTTIEVSNLGIEEREVEKEQFII
jgi:glycine/D-amino acid oxidase-like deaminating enzyme